MIFKETFSIALVTQALARFFFDPIGTKVKQAGITSFLWVLQYKS